MEPTTLSFTLQTRNEDPNNLEEFDLDWSAVQAALDEAGYPCDAPKEWSDDSDNGFSVTLHIDPKLTGAAINSIVNSVESRNITVIAIQEIEEE